MSTLRIVRVQGTPAERGRHIGSQLGDLIERSLSFYQRYLRRRGLKPAELEDVLAPYLRAAARGLPQYVEMVRGLAAGAMASFWEVFAVNALEELDVRPGPGEALSFLEKSRGAGPQTQPRPPRRVDRCSSFTVSGDGFTLLGHNEQRLAGDRGNIAVVIEEPPDGGPLIASPTVVCCLPAVGMNDRGGAQAIQSLAASDELVGMPRVLVSRHALDAADRTDAVRRATISGRAGGYAHVFAFRGGDAFTVETTSRRYSLLSGSGPHTNHYLDPALAAFAGAPSAASAARYARLLELIEERRPNRPEAVMEILRDHGGDAHSICLHPHQEAGEESEAVLFSMVCDVEAGRMWVAPDNPCVTRYEEIDLGWGVQGG
ncbi:MAG TPA: C45 family peptidase [Actinomycetota bacterium]|nr:C45 family peptidase [Actinomycetota bacterium]